MDFSDAIKLLKADERITRPVWGDNTWLILIHANEYELEAYKYFNATDGLSFIAIKTADNKITPWTPSHADLLAEDWILLK